jgi:hypothetical protein
MNIVGASTSGCPRRHRCGTFGSLGGNDSLRRTEPRPVPRRRHRLQHRRLTANTTGQSFEALTILTTICLAINLSVSAAMNIYNRRVTLRHLSYADWQLCASCRL